MHGVIVKRGREFPLHVPSVQKRELLRKFPFLLLKLSTLCRQLEDVVWIRRPPFAVNPPSAQDGLELFSDQGGLHRLAQKTEIRLEGAGLLHGIVLPEGHEVDVLPVQ